MYTVSVKKDFIAQHYLVGGDWGPENELNSHHFEVEVQLEGEELNEHGFLVDIVDIESNLDNLVDRYRDCTLNDFEEFRGLNPSIEHFSRIACRSLAGAISTEGLSAVTVRMYEDADAWASYRLDL